MKRKMSVYIFLMLLIIAVICIIAFVFFVDKVKIDTLQNGIAVFKYYIDEKENYNVDLKLTAEDERIILEIFDGKILYKDSPSCGFSDDIAITFNSGRQIFSIARDYCGVIYWKNKDKYFRLSDDENNIIRNILINNYGFIFPCI